MPNHKPYPILRALNREGDTFTLGALRIWMDDYYETPPYDTVVNDNDPSVAIIDPEVRRIEHKAETLIAALKEDEDLSSGKIEEKELPPYSAGLHLETHKPVVRRANKSAPLLRDYVDAEAETIRYMDAKKVRAWLGFDADVLDMAIGPHTYIDVGRLIGIDGSAKTAYRIGRLKVKGTAKTFMDDAA